MVAKRTLRSFDNDYKVNCRTFEKDIRTTALTWFMASGIKASQNVSVSERYAPSNILLPLQLCFRALG